MKTETIKLFLSATVPCGFADSEGKIQTNMDMTQLLGLNKDDYDNGVVARKNSH